MLSEEQQQKIIERLKRYSDIRIVGLVIFGVIALLVTWSGVQVMQTNYELQRKEAQLRAENEVNKLANENLKLKNTYFGTDHYLELSARRHFNKAEPGERLYLVPESVARSKTVDLPETATSSNQSVPKSKYQQNLERWLDFFFKN